MKNKLLSLFLFSLAVTGFSSCKKTWQCTCQATIAPTGAAVSGTYTIYNSYKINAQSDCDADCKQFLVGQRVFTSSATVKPL